MMNIGILTENIGVSTENVGIMMGNVDVWAVHVDGHLLMRFQASWSESDRSNHILFILPNI